MKIGVDKNQFSGSHGVSNRKKHKQMEGLGVELIPIPMPFGDYCVITEDIQNLLNSKNKICKKDLLGLIHVSIDTKKDLQELYGNVCAQHERFKKEILKPLEHNAKLIILCEHGDGIERAEDVYFFHQPEQTRFNKKTGTYYKQKEIKGQSLYRSICTMRERYNVQFIFCNKGETGKKIVELLGGRNP